MILACVIQQYADSDASHAGLLADEPGRFSDASDSERSTITWIEAIQYAISGVTIGVTYAIAAIGFALLYRATGWMNVLQGEFIMLGGVIASVAAGSMPLAVAVAVAAAITTAVGVASYDGVLRHVARRTHLHEAMIIAQLAVVLVIESAVALWIGTEPRTLPPFSSRVPLTIGEVFIARQTLWVIGFLIVSVALLQLYLSRTLGGRAMRASASNPTAARLVGIHPGTVRRQTLATCALLGGLAGAFITPSIGMSFNGGLPFAVNGFIAAVLGGFGSLTGAVAGGLVVGLIQAYAIGFGWSGYQGGIVGGLLLVVLLVRRDRVGALLGQGGYGAA